jgi:hypothetical protein
MGNNEAQIKMLKYSYDKIQTIEEYNRKVSYLNDFRQNGVIDEPTYAKLYKFLNEKLAKIK